MGYLGQLLQQYKFLYFLITRGHARFARSPLVIRLGDSRIRLGKSGYLQGGIDSIEFGVSVHRGS